MFSKIKSFVKNLFSAGAEEKSPVPAKPAKKKKRTAQPAAAVPSTAPKPKAKKKKAPAQTAPAPVAEPHYISISLTPSLTIMEHHPPL